MTPRRVRLPDGRCWLRVAKSWWTDPLDPGFAGERGGRWNPPGSHPTLYLNGDVVTARMQIQAMLAGYPVDVEDLDAAAFVLVAATLPRDQWCADAVSEDGVEALGLPASYPRTPSGEPIPRTVCQPIGASIREDGLRSVWCRSAGMPDGRGRELAWFPATSRSRARAVWEEPRPLSEWRDATGWADLDLDPQPDPRV